MAIQEHARHLACRLAGMSLPPGPTTARRAATEFSFYRLAIGRACPRRNENPRQARFYPACPSFPSTFRVLWILNA